MSIKEQILSDLAADIKNRYALDDILIKYKKYNLTYPQLMRLIGKTDAYKKFNALHDGKKHEICLNWTDDNKQMLADLYKAGKSYAEIGEAIGVTEIAVNAKICALRAEGVNYLPQRKGWTRHVINTNM